MAKINLLPWREALRERRKKEFFAISGAVALLGVVLSGLIWLFFNNQLQDQNDANQTVVAANQQLDRQLKELDVYSVVSEYKMKKNQIDSKC